MDKRNEGKGLDLLSEASEHTVGLSGQFPIDAVPPALFQKTHVERVQAEQVKKPFAQPKQYLTDYQAQAQSGATAQSRSVVTAHGASSSHTIEQETDERAMEKRMRKMVISKEESDCLHRFYVFKRREQHKERNERQGRGG